MSAGQPVSSLGHGKKQIICSLRAKQGWAAERAGADTDPRGTGSVHLFGWLVCFVGGIDAKRKHL